MLLELIYNTRMAPKILLQKYSGFTLVEILISLTIAALLLSWIAGFLISWLEATRKSEKQLSVGSDWQRQNEIIKQLQISGLIDSQSSGSWILLFSDEKNYLFRESTWTGYCSDSRPLNFLEITEILKNGEYETKEIPPYKIDPSGFSVLSGSTQIFGTSIQWGKISENQPLYTELWGASSLSISGEYLAISDPNNHRVFVLNRNNSWTFQTIDTLIFWLEYPISTEFTASWLEILGNRKGVFLEDIPSGTFNGTIKPKSTNKSGSPWIVTNIKTTFSGSNILNPGSFAVAPLCSYSCSDFTGSLDSPSGDSFSFTFTGIAPLTINDGESIWLDISGLSLSYTSGSWREYYGEVSLSNSGNSPLSTETFYYSTLWDGNIFSLNWNRISQVASGANLRKAGPSVWDGYLSWSLDMNLVQKIGNTDTLEFPIENLRLQETSDWKGYLLKYFKYEQYNCKDGSGLKKEYSHYFKKVN